MIIPTYQFNIDVLTKHDFLASCCEQSARVCSCDCSLFTHNASQPPLPSTNFSCDSYVVIGSSATAEKIFTFGGLPPCNRTTRGAATLSNSKLYKNKSSGRLSTNNATVGWSTAVAGMPVGRSVGWNELQQQYIKFCRQKVE